MVEGESYSTMWLDDMSSYASLSVGYDTRTSGGLRSGLAKVLGIDRERIGVEVCGPGSVVVDLLGCTREQWRQAVEWCALRAPAGVSVSARRPERAPLATVNGCPKCGSRAVRRERDRGHQINISWRCTNHQCNETWSAVQPKAAPVKIPPRCYTGPRLTARKLAERAAGDDAWCSISVAAVEVPRAMVARAMERVRQQAQRLNGYVAQALSGTPKVEVGQIWSHEWPNGSVSRYVVHETRDTSCERHKISIEGRDGEPWWGDINPADAAWSLLGGADLPRIGSIDLRCPNCDHHYTVEGDTVEDCPNCGADRVHCESAEVELAALRDAPPVGRFGDCPATEGGYFCTLDAGHRGDHVAHNDRGALVHQWPQGKVKPARVEKGQVWRGTPFGLDRRFHDEYRVALVYSSVDGRGTCRFETGYCTPVGEMLDSHEWEWVHAASASEGE